MEKDGKTGRLTTHVLDTAIGRPASGLRVELFGRDAAGGAVPLVDTLTNADGRCDAPLLAGSDMRAGAYEIRFHVGGYFRQVSPDVVPFYDVVPVPFVIADETAHYHVPLLVAPFGYSTYRGS